MANMPYEERIKNRDNDWYYNKCIRQYHFIIKSEGANQRYKEEIARLNKIIEEIETIFDTPYFDKEVSKQLGSEGFFTFKQMYEACNIVFKKRLQELKEEGKSQEIPLFEGTMEQLDNLTILKEEGEE